LTDRGLLLNLKLRSNPEMLCVVRSAVERLTEEMGFSEQESRSVTRAVDEALTNIMRHAYQGRPEQPIQVSCFHCAPTGGNQRECLEILLVDSGVAMDLSKLKVRSLDEVKPGGLGLHFIRASMDGFEYQRDGDSNHLRLVKYLPSPRAGHKS
jgi:anti-sigma regulatory factor (Ser/Thr protein kinase)